MPSDIAPATDTFPQPSSNALDAIGSLRRNLVKRSFFELCVDRYNDHRGVSSSLPENSLPDAQQY